MLMKKPVDTEVKDEVNFDEREQKYDARLIATRRICLSLVGAAILGLGISLMATGYPWIGISMILWIPAHFGILYMLGIHVIIPSVIPIQFQPRSPQRKGNAS